MPDEARKKLEPYTVERHVPVLLESDPRPQCAEALTGPPVPEEDARVGILESGVPAVRRLGRKPWQFGLRSIFLVTAAIAVWAAVFANNRENAMLESRIASLRPLARELVVDDPTQIAVVKLDELWYDENIWDVHCRPEATGCAWPRRSTRTGWPRA